MRRRGAIPRGNRKLIERRLQLSNYFRNRIGWKRGDSQVAGCSSAEGLELFLLGGLKYDGPTVGWCNNHEGALPSLSYGRRPLRLRLQTQKLKVYRAYPADITLSGDKNAVVDCSVKAVHVCLVSSMAEQPAVLN